ncbi:MAG: hypothetical protein V5804_00525 [Mucilaginibacter sp.]|uniref:hypothetical protein n=1 Tax=Mucilaginibacter sp. TaxID=1882438 RepID=UPI0034E5DBBB
MSVLVNTKNEQEEKVLLAFLNSLHYNYQFGFEAEADPINASFLDQYNNEIDQADSEIEGGDFVKHEDVELLFQQRRKVL